MTRAGSRPLNDSQPPYASPAGKYVLVTGATAGIGFHTARLLAAQGASLIITGRDPKRGADAAAAIRHAAGHDRVEFLPVDHSAVGANQELAALVMDRLDHLDVLVNNVGAISGQRLVTEDGFERSLAVNFLAPFVLTEALLPAITAAPGGARCVNVVSSAFQMVKGDPFDDLQAEKDYVGISVHGRAKLLTLLWSMGLSHRFPPHQLAVVAVNPGMAWTSMTQSLTPEVVPAWRYVFPLVQFFQRRADPMRAARRCEGLVLADAASVCGRYFDGDKHRGLPGKLADPTLPERVQKIGSELRASAPTARAPR